MKIGPKEARLREARNANWITKRPTKPARAAPANPKETTMNANETDNAPAPAGLADDLSVPSFLVRPKLTPEERKALKAKDAKAAKIKNPKSKASAAAKMLGANPSQLRSSGAKPKAAKAPKPAKARKAKTLGEAAADDVMTLMTAPAGTDAVAALEKGAKQRKAPRAPKVAAPAEGQPAAASSRPDGLRAGSKQALLLDAAVAAGSIGATEAELCKKLGGWKKCAVTLRRVCEKVGAKVERVEGRFVVTQKGVAA